MKTIFLISILLNFIFSFLWGNINNYLKIFDHNSVQKIHNGNICRFGGIIFLFCLFIYIYIFKISFHNSLIIFLSPIIFLACLEDFRFSTSPILRFIVTLIFGYIFFFMHPYPTLSILSILDSQYLIYLAPLFFSLCLCTLINSFNLIDGINGILGFISLIIITVLYHLDFNGLYHHFLILTFCLIVSFLLFNFPFGKIFFGDTGAYLLGIIFGITVIKIFNNYNYNEWLVLLIFIYPFTELLFTVIRRFKDGKSIFYPDSHHLHSIVFNFFRLKKFSNTKSSLLSLFVLLPLIIFPIITIYSEEFLMLLFNIILFFITYIGYYCFFIKYQKSNKSKLR